MENDHKHVLICCLTDPIWAPRNLLCQDGVFNAGTSEFIASDGYPRWESSSIHKNQGGQGGACQRGILSPFQRKKEVLKHQIWE